MKYPTFIRRRSALKDTLLCAHDAILRDRLSDFLRMQHPTNTAKEVARKARIPHRTVERWLAGLSSPRLEHFISLLHAYGPALLKAAMDDASIRDMNRMGGFDWVERCVRPKTRIRHKRTSNGWRMPSRFDRCQTQ